MNRVELASNIAKEMNITKKLATEFLNTFEEIVIDELVNNGDVSLVGFGKWSVKDCDERKGRNPTDGTELIIPAHRSPKFKFGKNFKDAVN